jgi:hypothetical protein
MKRVTRLLWPLLFAGLVIGLYNLKAQVEDQEKELARIQRAIEDEREAIQVLRAEWSYLNHPERLRRLAAANLDLQPAVQRQMASMARLAQRLAEAAPVESASLTTSREPAPATGGPAPQLGFKSR